MERAFVGDSTMTRAVGTNREGTRRRDLVQGAGRPADSVRHVGTLPAVEPSEPIRSRDLVRTGPFARLWWSQVISSLGDWVTLFATFSLAAKISGGGRAAPLAILVPLVARILPGLVIGILGGVVADRWNRKRTMVVADFGRAVLVGSLVLVGNFRDLFLLSFAIEVLSLVRQPAREAVVPRLIRPDQLLAANGLNLVAGYGTAPLGSALFALLAGVGEQLLGFAARPGVAAAFAFDAVTFIVSGAIVLTIDLPSTASVPRAEGRQVSALTDLRDGLSFVVTHGSVRRVVSAMAAGLFGGGALFVLGQPFAEQVLGAGDAGYGALVTSLGVGAAVGMGVTTVWGTRVERREAVFAAALTAVGVCMVLVSLAAGVAAAGGWVLVAGAGTGAAYVMGFTHLHASVTDDVRGRTFAALFASARAALLVSFGIAGLAAAALEGVLPGPLGSGIRLVLLLGGITIVVAGLAVLWGARAELRAEPLGEEAYRTLRDASDAITWMRGDRRGGDE